MLNGDAHHSKRRDGELRIGRCRVLKDQNAERIPEWDAIVAIAMWLAGAVSIYENRLVARLASCDKLRRLS